MTVVDDLQSALPERILTKINMKSQEECWLWLAHRVRGGYGQAWVNGKHIYAHRLVFSTIHGDIPEGQELDHTCYNRSCVNPLHMRLVSRHQNMQNLSGAFRISKSGIRGVSWNRDAKAWVVLAATNNKQVFYGYHSDIEQARAVSILVRNIVFTNSDADIKDTDWAERTISPSNTRWIDKAKRLVSEATWQ